MIKSNPIPEKWVTHKIISKKFSHCCEGSESHVRLPSLRIRQRDWESPENLTLKASRIWLQDFRRPGETETPVLEGTNKALCAPRLRGKEQWLHGYWTKTCWCWRVSRGGVGWQGLTTGMGLLAAAVWEGPLWHKSSWRSPLTRPQSPKTRGLGRLRPKKLPGREYTWIKAYWARPCPPEQEPVFPTSPSHTEAYTIPLASSIRGQTEERKATTPQ